MKEKMKAVVRAEKMEYYWVGMWDSYWADVKEFWLAAEKVVT